MIKYLGSNEKKNPGDMPSATLNLNFAKGGESINII